MRGQVNLIVIAGMIIATIIALLNGFTFINEMGLATHIYQSAENSITQTLIDRSFINQQATYRIELAELLTGLNLSTNCGYITTASTFPFLPMNKVYYWVVNNKMCFPNDSEIYKNLITLLSSPSFASINSSSYSRFIRDYAYVNLTGSGVYTGQFTFYPLKRPLTIVYNRNSGTFSIQNGSTTLYSNLPLLSNISIKGFNYIIGPEASVYSGVVSQPMYNNAFFSQMPENIKIVTVISAFTLVYIQGIPVVVFDYNQSGYFTICLSPIIYLNRDTLAAASGGEVVCPYTTTSYNPLTVNYVNSFSFLGQQYTMQFTGNETDLSFFIYPSNYATLEIQPEFLTYAYSVMYSSSSQNSLLVPPSPGYIQIKGLAINNAQVCAYEKGIGYSIYNCIPLSVLYSSQNYLSEELHSAINFANDTFPVGGGKTVQGFPQYVIYNYLYYETHVVNMRSILYYGKPLYDWYADLLLMFGYPQDISFNGNTYTASQQTVEQDVLNSLLNLLNYQLPVETQILSAIPYTVSVYKLDVYAYDKCNPNNNINIQYTAPISSSLPSSQAVIPLPISIVFLYSNTITLNPTISCNLEDPPTTPNLIPGGGGAQPSVSNPVEFNNCYPGFVYDLKANLSSGGTVQFSCCSPIVYSGFINSTCFANIATNDTNFVNAYEQSGGSCTQIYYKGQSAYECNIVYRFNSNYDRILYSDTCPNSVDLLLDGSYYNFSIFGKPTGTFHIILDQYNEIYNNYYSNYSDWIIGISNKTNLSGSYTIEVAENISGLYPSENLILCQRNNLSNNCYAMKIFPNNVNQLIYLKDNSVKAQHYSTIPANSLTKLYLIRNDTGLYLLSNSNLQLKDNSFSLSKLGLFGISTTGYPSNINIQYIIGYYNYPSVYLATSPAYNVSVFNSTTLGQRILKTTYQGSKLISKIPPSSVVNVVYLEGGNFSNEYVLKLQLNPNFLLFSPNDTEIFGIYNNGSYKPLYWYNLTPISYGNSLWINLTNHTPQYLLVAYGEEIKDKYYSASKTFPIAVIPGKINFTYIWIKGKKISTNTYSMISGYIGNNSVKGFGYYSSNPLTISQTGMIPDYVYNTSLNGTEYETFACVYNGKENTEAYIMNVSFYGGNLAYNSQQEIYGYNDIYPEATIIGNYETVTFSAPTGYIITQNNNYHRLCFKEGASWACII